LFLLNFLNTLNKTTTLWMHKAVVVFASIMALGQVMYLAAAGKYLRLTR